MYEQLADALDKLPNGFPKTPSHLEIAILKKIFSPEEAALAAQLTGSMEPVHAIAERVGTSVKEARTKLMSMVKRGVIWFEKRDGTPHFRLAPFVVGFYEAQLNNMDHELAHLIEEYMDEGGAAGLMKLQPALHRVIPVQGATKSEWVLPYDDVRAVLLKAQTFRVHDCICRVQQAYVGHECHFPLKMCLSFSENKRPASQDDISREEALAILDKSEDVGLVHTVSNVAEGIGYVCNCCGCCCGILLGITKYGIDESVAYANYYAVIDADTCVGCGTCIERCQVNAIAEQDGVAVVDRAHCIGCGLCITGCPNGTAQLYRKPEEQIAHPPQNFAAWEQERLINRGVAHRS
jgi:ferredoxin